MIRKFALELSAHLGESVTVKGWLHSFREMGRLGFLILRDRTGLIQVVFEEKEKIRELATLQPGSTLCVKGELVPSKCEMHCEIIRPSFEVISAVKEPLPIDYDKPKMAADLEHQLDFRPLSLRHRENVAIFKIQAEITHAYRLFMHDHAHATEYFAPCMLSASSEGGSEFFTVDYFGYPATLAQSSQLYKQMMVGVYERVFALMPFFRAEPSQTTRHLTEGKQFEFEMGFFESWHELLDVQESCLKFIVRYLETHCAKELEILGVPLAKAPIDVPFPRLTFKEAQELFWKRTGIDERNEPDLSPHAERELCAWAKESFGTDFVFVTDWLTEKRPFYAYPNKEDSLLTDTMDLLCAGTEISSGGARRYTFESMVEGLKAKGMNPDNFTDYLSIFRYGMPPHGGFGMGLERLTMTLLGLKNIRQVSLFPSDPKRIAAVRIKKKIFFGAESIRNELSRLIKKESLEALIYSHPAENPTHEGMGVKALILRGQKTKKNIMCCLPLDGRIDMKMVTQLAGEKFEFESPEVIFERFGLKVGGVPPFGHLLGLETWYDSSIKEIKGQLHVAAGDPEHSIKLSAQDLCSLSQAEFAPLLKISP